jgi:UDP-N-acetylmuramyl pentapeptide phosphotransferase/UDP-N-acetylglucosamine-1-phosphate transferase
MSGEAILKYPVMFLAGLITAMVVTRVWKQLALQWGFMDQPGGRKLHRAPIPSGGGIAVFIGFHVACAALFLFPWKPFAGQISIDWWFRFIPLSMGVVALGLVDDRTPLKPATKLAGQLALAIAAYAMDIRLQNVLGLGLPGWVDFLGTIAWFMVLMNSFNLIDGVDGLASGIALIAALGIAISLVFRKAPGDVLLFIGFAGACLGFLRYNFYPASVFLGDTGSLFVGFTLAALAISTSSKAPAIAAIGMPLLAVGVPMFDTLLAIWRRSMRRLLADEPTTGVLLGIDQGDADHLHHRLLGPGRGHRRVAWLLYAATASLALVGILASVFHDRALGILGLSFLIAAYTVVRHLAWVELRESGEVVLRGLTRPVRRNQTLLFYIAADILILSAALLVSSLLIDIQDGRIDARLKMTWLRAAPTDVVIPFIILLLFHSYSRVWYLARISEYIGSGFAVILGSAVACAVNLLAYEAGQVWPRILYYTLFAGIAAPAVVGIRASVRVVQDLMHWRQRGLAGGRNHPARALICGAGYPTTLFLRQMAFKHNAVDPVAVIGLIASDDAIRGHYIHGIKVLGNYAEIPVLADEYQVDRIYLIEDLNEDRQRALRDTRGNRRVRIIHWQVNETEWSVPDRQA